MTDEASPRPWSVDGIDISDANGEPVTPLYFNEQDEANAALIVDAVNERDRLRAELADKTRNYEDVIAFHTRTEESLRDIVRDALPFIEGAIDTASTIIGDAEMSKAVGECGAPPKDVLEAFVADGRRVLREARAAIGEDAP